MTDASVERAFHEHPDFEKIDDEQFETPEKPFPGVVTVTGETDPEADGQQYRIAVRTPMLDAVVEGEEVAEVVENGWFETLELRLEDAHTVTNTDSATPPSIEREGDEVVVTVEFDREETELAVEDALAVVEYVEGTWVQGIIPGYDYGEPAASLRQRAQQNYDEDGQGGASDASPR